MKVIKRIFLLITIFILTSSFTTVHCPNFKTNNNFIEVKPKFSVKALTAYMTKIGIHNQNIVLKQAILETGWFTSHAFKYKHNLFGLSNSNGSIKYDHWTESVDKYKLIQTYKYKGGDYYDFLTNMGYAEDSLYIFKLKQIKI